MRPNTSTAVSAASLEGESEAMAEAKETGERVEVADLTTPYTRVVADPAGHFVAEMSPAPVRVRRDDGWVPVDLSLQADDSGRLVPAASPVDVSVSADGTGPLVELAKGERRLALTWPGKLSAPVVDGARATYPDVFPGVDLVVESQLPGFSTFLVVESAEAASNPALRTIDFGLEVTGVTVTAKAGGRFEARDAANGVVFSTDPARMWDDGPPSVFPWFEDPIQERPGAASAVMSASVQDVSGRPALRVAPDLELLRGSETRYPVVIDPGWKTNSQQEAEWGMVWSNGMDFHNSAHVPRVGYDGWSSAPKKSRSFYEFGMKRFWGDQINSATFRHHQTHSPGWSCDTTDGPSVRVYRSEVFGSGISWPGPGLLGFQGAVGKAHGHEDVCPGYDVNEWDVTVGVSNAVSNRDPEFALGMVSANESDKMGWRKYQDNSTAVPQLIVEYNTRPGQPTDVQVWNSPTDKANWFTSLNGWYTNALEPRVGGRVDDPDGDALQYRFEVWKDSTMIWDLTTTPYPANTYVDKRVGGGAITQERRYRFRMRGIDDLGWAGPWSDWTYFTVDKTAPDPPKIVPPKQEISFDQGGYFRFEPGPSGAARYHYGFTTSTPTTFTPWSTDDAARSVLRQAVRFGPDWVRVVALDLAGNPSAPADLDFRVKGAEATHVWHLDDSSATLGGMDLSLVGSPSWVEGLNRWYSAFGGDPVSWNTTDGGLELNGTSEYAETTGPVLADTSKSFSVSAWVRLDPVAAAGNNNVVVSQPGLESSAFYLEYQQNGWAFRVRAADGYGTLSTAKVPANLGDTPRWVHLVGVYKRPRNLDQAVVQLYVDGELAAETSAKAGAFQATEQLQIGASRWTGSANNFLAGVVDEVRVFPGAVDPLGARVLSTEIRDRSN